MKHFRRWGAVYLLVRLFLGSSEWLQSVFQAILLLGAKHWLFQADAEDMERLEKKVDAIQARLGLDPNESDEPLPEQEQEA